MNAPNDSTRQALRVIGPVVIVLGVLLILFGIQDEQEASKRRDQQSREFMAGTRDIHDIERGPPAGFFMIGGGMFAIVIGLGLTAISFQQAMLRYQLRQAAPVVREAIREVAPAFGGAARPCPRCHTENPADARFCKQCGAPLAPAPCPGCGASNDPDARFCARCGTSLEEGDRRITH